MRRVIFAALALVLAGPLAAQVGDMDTHLRCKGGDCLSLDAHPDLDNPANLRLIIVANSTASPVTQIVIATAKGAPLATCSSSVCIFVWTASKMIASESYSVTATRRDGVRFSMTGTLTRP